MFKKGISLTVILLLLLTTFMFVFAETSDEDKADELNQLNLIAGDDTGYNLNGELKRSEAATFIVKLLGKEEQVLKNKVIYVNTNFPDVPAEEWYATFVGFCARENIISGYPDGTFQPNTTLSEKAFFSMMLKSLGYTDVAWDDINTKAYEVGLVRDNSYVGKTSDNTNFTRGDVVNIMHNSLKLKINDTNKTVVERLIEEGAASSTVATSLNLLAEDTTLTAISSVEADTDESLIIKLNEEIESLTMDQISVYKKSDSSELLDVDEFKLDGKVLTLETEKQPFGEKYVVSLTSILDKDNNYSQKVVNEFSTFTIKEVESAYFRINRVESIKDDRLNVYFTHPIKTNASIPTYYSLYDSDGDIFVEGDFDTIEAKKLGGDDNVLGILLKKNTMEEGETYTLKITDDLNSTYYASLNSGKGDKFTFVSGDYQSESFKVKNVELLKNKVFRVTFSSDVDMGTALNSKNYSLVNDTKDVNHGKAVDVVASGRVGKANELRQVDVVFGSNIIEDDVYELTIDDVKNIFEDRKISEDTKDVYAYYDDEYKIEITSVVAFNDSHLRVYLNEIINASSTDVASISISPGPHNDEATASIISDDTIDIFLQDNQTLSNDDYELTILPSIEDIYGEVISSMSAEFDGDSSDAEDEFGIDTAIHVADDIVLVELDEPISTTKNDEDNFILKYVDSDDKTKTVSVDEIHFLDAYTVIVECDELSDDVDYKIYIVDARDFSDQYIIDDFYKKVTY